MKIRDMWKEKQKTPFTLFPGDAIDDDDGYKKDYMGTWKAFKDTIESRLIGLNEQDKETVVVHYYHDYDDGTSFRIHGTYLETDTQQAERIRIAEKKQKELQEKQAEIKEAIERKEYERLKKKFEPSNSQLSPANGGDPHAGRRTSHVPWD